MAMDPDAPANHCEGRNIVVCLDGTANQFRGSYSNVARLYRVMVKNPELQLGYYDPGVGTLPHGARTPAGRRVSLAMGLAFGYGLTQNIREAYLYLMNTYQTGDRVFIFGFSRGAYTAKALAGMLHKMGLLERGNENLVDYAIEYFKNSPSDADSELFKRTFSRECKTHFLGLWDAVKSVGWVYNFVKLPYTRRNPSVVSVRHALALDERRVFFQPSRWARSPAAGQSVKEVWFAGVHSDVGGSYPESRSGLSKLAFAWMVGEAVAAGLVVDPAEFDLVFHSPGSEVPSPTAFMNESLVGLWRVCEWLPRGRDDLYTARGLRAKLRLALKGVRPHRGRKRFVRDDDLVHWSVIERLEDPKAQYAVGPWHERGRYSVVARRDASPALRSNPPPTR
jgi:uncharacterized protein (DUF2235 family)